MSLEFKSGPRLPGCCLCCDRDCMEHVYPDYHPKAGLDCGIGPMRDDACQVEFFLSDGSMTPITFCMDCADAMTPSDYPAIMQRVRVSWDQEINDEWRKEHQLAPWTEEMKIKYRKRHYEVWIVGKLWKRRPKSFTDVRIV